MSALWLKDVLPLYWSYEEQLPGGPKTTRDHLEYQESGETKEARVVSRVAPLYKGRVLYLRGKFVGDGEAAPCFRIARPSHESLALSSESDTEKQIKLLGKEAASYWSGLMAYEQGNYPSAAYYLLNKTIDAYPDGPWTTGARYNLARTYEALGKPDLAILLYTGNTASPGYLGDLLRSQWLKELGEKRKPAKE